MIDWRQAVIDQPLLALLVVVPIVGLGALIKIGVVLLTGRDRPEDGEAPP